jgi:hypothetical protein
MSQARLAVGADLSSPDRSDEGSHGPGVEPGGTRLNLRQGHSRDRVRWAEDLGHILRRPGIEVVRGAGGPPTGIAVCQ